MVLKVDGLSADVFDRWVHDTDSRTGKSQLPWIRHVFLENGAWVKNFYVRGISVSAPSWSMLDSGQHMVIHGNVEYDRLTGHVYDYLNPFPFYVNYARSRRTDMPSVEVLDEAGMPLLIDRFSWDQRYQSPQLLQRGVRWETLAKTPRARFLSRSPWELFNEWQIGFDMTTGLSEQVERDIVSSLAGGHVLYLDYFFGDFDHLAHLDNSEASQLAVLKRLDRIVGRIWTAIRNSPLAGQTLVVLVSDHGMNSSPKVFSQGYNLIHFLASAEGGGHNVLTARYPMSEYRLKGLNPFVSTVTTRSAASHYLNRDFGGYPTAMLDVDGNERASVYLRHSDFNLIHILLNQLDRPGLDARTRGAARNCLRQVIESHRQAWRQTSGELEEELAALHRAIERKRLILNAQSKIWTLSDRQSGREQQARRERSALAMWEDQERAYRQYLASLKNLLRLPEDELKSGKIRVEAYLGRRLAGEVNSIYNLQNYIVSAAPGGLAAQRDGTVSLERSFETINYFVRLAGIRVRNNVQPGVGPRPVDFVAARVGAREIGPALAPGDQPDQDVVWLYGDDSRQGLILSRAAAGGDLYLKYLPIKGLRQDASGRVRFQAQPWAAGFPLRMFEDPNLNVTGDRAAWLSGWHSEREWLEAVHRTVYSNAIIGLHEFFREPAPGPVGNLWSTGERDESVLRRFVLRKRRMAAPDMLVVASDHWNFNVRGFNPGGNHGSFLRISTHSLFLLAGGGIPRGITIERPYDSLSFAPTLIRLLGGGNAALQAFPGALVEELMAGGPGKR